MTRKTYTVYTITRGKYKGKFVVKTDHLMLKSAHVRALQPYPLEQLFGYSETGTVNGSKRLGYPEYVVLKRLLQPVGTIVLDACFGDKNGQFGACGPSGFELLEKYYGKSKSEIARLAKSYKMPPDHTKRINFD